MRWERYPRKPTVDLHGGVRITLEVECAQRGSGEAGVRPFGLPKHRTVKHATRGGSDFGTSLLTIDLADDRESASRGRIDVDLG